MRVLELSLRNFRVFDEVDLELPARVIGIFGPNGSGKSTLVESIAFALYGVDAARTKKDGIRTHGVLTDCEVRVVFEHAGQHYEVRRGIKGRGHAAEAELYVGGLALATGTTEVTAEIVRLLHMELSVFRASVFAEQKQLDALSDQTTAKRKEMALRLLGIKPVDEARSAARREARSATTSAAQLDEAVADTAALESALKEATDLAAEVEASAAAAAASLAEVTTTAASARTAFDAIDDARQRVEKLAVAIKAATGERETIAADIAERRARVARLEAELAELPGLEDALVAMGDVEERVRAAERLLELARKLAEVDTAIEAAPTLDAETALAAIADAERVAADAAAAEARATAERDAVVARLADAEAHLSRALEADPSEPCPTCGQPLGDGFAAYVEGRRGDVDAAKEHRAGAERSLRDAAIDRERGDAALAEARRVGEEARGAATIRDRLAAQAAELRAEAEPLLEVFDGETPDVDALRTDADRVRELRDRVARLGSGRERLEETRTDMDALVERLRASDERIASLAEDAEAISFDPDEHARLAEALRGADAALDQARVAERVASDAHKEAEKTVGRLGGELAQARQTAEKVAELRAEARYLERTSMLLDGFRDHLVARVGPELSREAEALFRELTNHEYDDLRIHDDTLAIEIADGDAYFPISRFSGSETDLANLALRVAISTHLSRVSGADVGFMVLDEVLGSLDHERKDLMVQAMGRLASRFHQLFVITHAEQVKDQFPASIVVQKTGRRRSGAVLL